MAWLFSLSFCKNQLNIFQKEYLSIGLEEERGKVIENEVLFAIKFGTYSSDTDGSRQYQAKDVVYLVPRFICLINILKNQFGQGVFE